ncbi:hypothetical protein QBC46DRAFT_440460 [Diplogelasinospora grovesii]|uniref:Uncharacterized protein n=1 Tax=Diplogelasinospora grovesii TaxID=303347 RepID=A0AAN6S2W1_9PEZI|nr:hypothetical protein QBC46DRAFT_440460 [Diplogelasinospora grovesii]
MQSKILALALPAFSAAKAQGKTAIPTPIPRGCAGGVGAANALGLQKRLLGVTPLGSLLGTLREAFRQPKTELKQPTAATAATPESDASPKEPSGLTSTGSVDLDAREQLDELVQQVSLLKQLASSISEDVFSKQVEAVTAKDSGLGCTPPEALGSSGSLGESDDGDGIHLPNHAAAFLPETGAQAEDVAVSGGSDTSSEEIDSDTESSTFVEEVDDYHFAQFAEGKGIAKDEYDEVAAEFLILGGQYSVITDNHGGQWWSDHVEGCLTRLSDKELELKKLKFQQQLDLEEKAERELFEIDCKLQSSELGQLGKSPSEQQNVLPDPIEIEEGGDRDEEDAQGSRHYMNSGYVPSVALLTIPEESVLALQAPEEEVDSEAGEEDESFEAEYRAGGHSHLRNGIQPGEAISPERKSRSQHWQVEDFEFLASLDNLNIEFNSDSDVDANEDDIVAPTDDQDEFIFEEPSNDDAGAFINLTDTPHLPWVSHSLPASPVLSFDGEDDRETRSMPDLSLDDPDTDADEQSSVADVEEQESIEMDVAHEVEQRQTADEKHEEEIAPQPEIPPTGYYIDAEVNRYINGVLVTGADDIQGSEQVTPDTYDGTDHEEVYPEARRVGYDEYEGYQYQGPNSHYPESESGDASQCGEQEYDDYYHWWPTRIRMMSPRWPEHSFVDEDGLMCLHQESAAAKEADKDRRCWVCMWVLLPHPPTTPLALPDISSSPAAAEPTKPIIPELRVVTPEGEIYWLDDFEEYPEEATQDAIQNQNTNYEAPDPLSDSGIADMQCDGDDEGDDASLSERMWYAEYEQHMQEQQAMALLAQLRGEHMSLAEDMDGEPEERIAPPTNAQQIAFDPLPPMAKITSWADDVEEEEEERMRLEREQAGNVPAPRNPSWADKVEEEEERLQLGMGLRNRSRSRENLPGRKWSRRRRRKRWKRLDY